MMEPAIKVEPSLQQEYLNVTTQFEVEIKVELESESGQDNYTEPIEAAPAVSAQLDILEKKTHSCDVCQAAFEQEHLLAVHTQTHSLTNIHIYPCKLCIKSFSTPDKLSKHMKKRHPKTNLYTCNKCDKISKNMSHWKSHINTHVGLKPYTCSCCFRKFTQKIGLDRHMLIHTGEKPFKCTRCDKSFGRARTLKQHEKLHDRKHNLPFSCDQCGKGYADKKALIRHIRNFHTAGSYPCNICGNIFASKYLLSVHYRTYKNEMERKSPKKLFNCKVCEETIHDYVNLKHHMKLHGDVKPYVCGHCGKSFGSESRLKSHETLHRSEKPFDCDKCGQIFKKKGDLMTHLQLHLTGEIPNSKKTLSLPQSSIKFDTLPVRNIVSTLSKQSVDRGNKFAQELIKQEITDTETRKAAQNKYEDAKQIKEEVIDVPVEYDSTDNYTEVPLVKHCESTDQPPETAAHACYICGKEYISIKSLRFHVKTHSEERPFKCDSCDSSFHRKSTLITHQRIHTGEKVSCHKCNKQFTQRSSLGKHLKIHNLKHKTEPAEPIDISNTFGAQFIRNHNVSAKHICMICGKDFKMANSLVRHMKCHTGVKPFKCDLCDRGFHQKGNLLTHQATHNAGEKKRLKHRFSCDLCPKMFTRKKYLKEHVHTIHVRETHKLVPNFTCSYCDKSFLQKRSLKIHIRTHTGERPHSCTECDKCFTKRSTLKIHMRTHSGERTHPCGKCGATFSQPSSLGTHDKSVHGEKSHVCYLCSQTFSRKDSLSRHLKRHSGDKPYKCNICNRSFACGRNFETHQLTHIDGRHYNCERCHEAFKTSRQFYLHLKSHALNPTSEVDIVAVKTENVIA